MATRTPELLAPAGNEACLHAAVRAGADAVYLGVDSFNARRGADNFTLETLKGACDWAHLRGVRVYLTLNTIVLPSEFDSALEVARQAWAAGVDAFIVQDIGLACAIVQSIPDAEVHASTQMNTHNAAGVSALATLGATRVTLSRELALPEIERLCDVAHGCGLGVEVFAHGALCICYSGQCFASSLVGGRSANRGMCAQVCRLPYELHSASVRAALPAEGDHLLSPKDLCTIERLGDLVAAGVDSLKVEGRMKSADYVYSVVSVYREVLDSSAPPSGQDMHRRLAEAFSRGFTEGYLAGETGNALMSYTRPNNRGVLVGRVKGVGAGRVDVDCDVPLAAGDVVEFWTKAGHFTHTVGAHDVCTSTEASLAVEKPVGKTDRVFRVRSAAAAFDDDACEPRVPVRGAVALRIGHPARLSLALSRDPATEAHAEGATVEAARTKAVTEQEVCAHIDRFGVTPFSLENLDVELDEGTGMSFSSLHHLRAGAAAKLEERLLVPWTSRRLPKAPDAVRSSGFAPAARPSQVEVCAWATNPTCARVARKAGADVIFVPALNYKRGEALVAGQRSSTVEQAGYPKRVCIALPTIDHDPVSGSREARFGFDAWDLLRPGATVFADSLAAVLRALDEGMKVEVGPHVPVTNARSAQWLVEAGVSRIWLSPELTLGQIQDLAQACAVPLGLFVSGAAEVMVTEHCLLQSQGDCNQECATCPRRTTPHFLKDRKGYEMPVVTDCCGRSHLYNAVALDACHLAGDLVGAGVTAFMVDTTLLNVADATASVSRAVRARDLALRDAGALPKTAGTTTGHLFRAVS